MEMSALRGNSLLLPMHSGLKMEKIAQYKKMPDNDIGNLIYILPNQGFFLKKKIPTT